MNYHNITHCDQNNGDGLRVVFWVSGCSHNCYNCQNHQTWNPKSGIEFDCNAKKELIEELQKDFISGITLTGGDPLYEENLKDVLDLVNEIRLLYGDTKTIWLYSGYDFEVAMQDELRSEIIRQCDVMVDGRYIDNLRDITLKWRGSSNQRVIDIKSTLEEGHVVLWTN